MPLLVFIIFLCVGLALRHRALGDPDTFWHVAAGDLIRAEGLPQSDSWSHTAGGHPWYNLSWAYDVAASLLHQAGGFPALAASAIVVYAFGVAAVAWLALKTSRSLIAALVVAILAGLVLLPGMLARPHGITFILVALVYGLLRFAPPRAVWTIPLLMIIWANVHGGFLAAFTIIGAFGLEALWRRDWRAAMRLAGVGAVSALALLINPYGINIIDGAMATMGSVMKPLITEWRPLNGADAMPMLYAAALFLVSALYDRRIPLADKLLAFAWLAIGFSSARLMMVAAILAAPYLAQGIALRLAQTPFAALIAGREKDYAGDLARAPVRIVLACLALLMTGALLAPPTQHLISGGGVFAAAPERIAPAAAASVIEARYADLVLFNDYDFGGYLTHRFRGRTPVFLDGRADTAYPRAVLEDAIKIGYMAKTRTAEPDEQQTWTRLVAKYGVEMFVTNRESRLAGELARRGEWMKIHEDDTAALFVRSDLARP